MKWQLTKKKKKGTMHERNHLWQNVTHCVNNVSATSNPANYVDRIIDNTSSRIPYGFFHWFTTHPWRWSDISMLGTIVLPSYPPRAYLLKSKRHEEDIISIHLQGHWSSKNEKPYNFSLKTTREWELLFVFILAILDQECSLGSNSADLMQKKIPVDI